MPKKTAKKAKVVKRVTGPRVSSSSSTLSPDQIKLGLVILGVVLLVVALPVGLIVLAVVAFHHFFSKSRR